MLPPTHSLLRSNGAGAWFGWPEIPAIESGIRDWFDAGSQADAGRTARGIQEAAFREVPYYPLGQFRQPYAFRRDMAGMVRAPIPVLWNVRRG
ncbi:hypothetical protein VQH23_08870 [Pararoseomonas sp. SCSIO 73927]|uniref:hypothetical protein n=1 Tax=Pararoseomonas sp. SCSIO 73927 TaxID=3114537 RepID=UPI0030D3E2E8